MLGKILKKSFDQKVLVVGTTRFWAERGLIHYERDGGGRDSYGTMGVRQFLRHVQGIARMLGNSSAKRDHVRDAALRREYQEIIDRSVLLARTAQEQGTPDDDAARREYVRRRPKTICMSGGNSQM